MLKNRQTIRMMHIIYTEIALPRPQKHYQIKKSKMLHQESCFLWLNRTCKLFEEMLFAISLLLILSCLGIQDKTAGQPDLRSVLNELPC